MGRMCDIRPHVRLHEGVAVGDQSTIGEQSVVLPGIRIYPFKEVESGTQVDRNLIWESRASSTIFGREGISGLINVDLTPEIALRLGMALGTVLQRGARVVTSREAPSACRLLRRAVLTGINATGVHVADLRVMPSAVTRHLLKSEGFEAGVHVRQSAVDPEAVDAPDLRAARGRGVERVHERGREALRPPGVSAQRLGRRGGDPVPGAGIRELRAGPARHARHGCDPLAGIPHRRSATRTRRPRSSSRSSSVTWASRSSRPRRTCASSVRRRREPPWRSRSAR